MTGRERPALTSERTIVRGPPGPGGWCDLADGPGEAYAVAVPTGQPLACLWHLSDLHLCDAESPARLEYLDRLSDPDSPYREALGDVGTYRPQEVLTVQVAVAMSDVVNAVDAGPVSGRPVDAVLLTGDLTDNAQANELAWFEAVAWGGVVAARSGDAVRSAWVGASDDSTWDERYWHPDGPPPGMPGDRPMRLFGFPLIPGLVEAGRADVLAPGLGYPLIAVHGNHDALLQGTVPADDALRSLAVGTRRVTALPASSPPLSARTAIAEVGPARYPHTSASPRQSVEPDAGRRLLAPGDFARMAGALPRSLADSARTFFATDVGEVRLVVLDTVNPHGGWQGSIDAPQWDWLVEELERSRDRYVVVASHHPSPTMVNDYVPPGGSPRILGPAVVDLLLAHPNVIAWLAGHVHHHNALHHGASGEGFWEITTASLIDWPQQSRVVEILRVRDGADSHVAIVSTVADHSGPAVWSPQELDDSRALAAISRALAANDYRIRGDALRGLVLQSRPEVRNTVWRVRDPLA